MKTIWDYFDEVIEFPKNVVDNPIPYGVCWQYISNTFLNGFINYVQPIGCYVVNRYTKETALLESELSVCNKGEFGKWHKFEGTKKELIDAIISGEKEVYHTKLSCFEDDIIVIGRVDEDTKGKYIFFWFDMDVSDCCIGKFKTDDSEEGILKSVEKWLNEEFQNTKSHETEHEDENGFHKLPVTFIKGWVSF